MAASAQNHELFSGMDIYYWSPCCTKGKWYITWKELVGVDESIEHFPRCCQLATGPAVCFCAVISVALWLGHKPGDRPKTNRDSIGSLSVHIHLPPCEICIILWCTVGLRRIRQQVGAVPLTMWELPLLPGHFTCKWVHPHFSAPCSISSSLQLFTSVIWDHRGTAVQGRSK